MITINDIDILDKNVNELKSISIEIDNSTMNPYVKIVLLDKNIIKYPFNWSSIKNEDVFNEQINNLSKKIKRKYKMKTIL